VLLRQNRLHPDRLHVQESERMKDYNDKILRGSEIRGDQLRLPRARAIYRSVNNHEYAEMVRCQRNTSQDEILTFRLKRLQIPEYPEYTIRTEETVAVVCHKIEETWPDVYALRNDFPLGLPHSNAKPYKRPVSICVADYVFYDVRLQFSAYDFINSIRHWFEKNSIGELHEKDRPLEIFMMPDGVCAQRGKMDIANPYLNFKKITDFTYTVCASNKEEATHCMMTVVADQTIATSMVYKPRTLGELSDIIKIYKADALMPYVVLESAKIPKYASRFPILLFVLTNQKRATSEDTRSQIFAVEIVISPQEIVNQFRTKSLKEIYEWLRTYPIKLYDYRDDVCIENNMVANGVKEFLSDITFIGCGTLGSNVIDHFFHKGICAKMVVIDNDYYFPHNYGRHILPASNVMEKKVIALKKLYKDIQNLKITPIFKNACTLTTNEQKEFYGDASLIVDASTVIAVERHLARDISIKNGRCCSIFLNPQGTDLVLLMEDNARTKRLDLLEMAYYSAILDNDSLQNHLEVPEQQRTSTFSCRSESNIIDYDDVGVLASIASREIQRHHQEAEAKAEIWRINKQEGNVTRVEIPIHEWELYESDGVKVYVSMKLQDTLNKERNAWGEYETGGCLCGCYDRDRCIIYVFAQIPAPPDSKRTQTSFERGTEGLNEAKQEIAKRTYFQVRYIGEWHSHPHSDSRPSTLDKEQFSKLDNELLQQDVPFVQMICGEREFYVKCRM